MWCSSHQKNITACCPVFCNLWFMQEYAEFQYRRRHRQRRRGDMHSLLSNTPDPDDPSESTLGMVLPGAVCSLLLLQKLLVATTVFSSGCILNAFQTCCYICQNTTLRLVLAQLYVILEALLTLLCLFLLLKRNTLIFPLAIP